jgi:hypothetical protein
MELDELKNTWAALDNRLKENNALNETIVLKMTQGKAEKSLNRLIFWDIFSVFILIAVIPFIVYWLDKYSGRLLFGDIVVIYGGIICVVYAIWYIYKIRLLVKINVTENIHNNIYYTNKYAIMVKREKLAMSFIGPSIALLCIAGYAEAKVSVSLWIFLTSILILASLLTAWSYKRLYQKNIDSILKSLEEIKDLEEE